MPPRRRTADTIPHAPDVLDALRQCRKVMLDATTEVRQFGADYHALSMVTTAIDALALYITGQRDHFAIGGSVAPQTGRNGIPD